MWLDMCEQPDVLARFTDRWDSVASQVRALLGDTPPRAVVTLARGSSDNAAVLAGYLIERAAGVPVASGSLSLWTRYGHAGDYRDVLAVGVSQSGGTPEIAQSLHRMRECGARTIALTNDPDSPLALAAQLCVPLGAGVERAVPATKTVTAQFLGVACLAAALGGVRPQALAQLPAAVADVLADPDPAARLARRWRDCATLLVVARGSLLAAAAETALKVRETAGMLAVGTSSADLLHGPIAAVAAGTPVLLTDADPATGEDLADVARRLEAVGADVQRLSPTPDVGAALQPIVETVRGQQLALELALARGLSPDSPRGLSKITLTA
jgi:glucosamine--fructose-6-phosphate aminotransferase (isomerizing)